MIGCFFSNSVFFFPLLVKNLNFPHTGQIILQDGIQIGNSGLGSTEKGTNFW